MIKGTYEYLLSLASRNVCSEHKTPLEVAWYSADRTWVLRCGHDHNPDAITKQLSLTEMHKAGEPLPEHIEDKVRKGIRKRAMEQSKQPTAITFAGVPATDLGTGELLPRDKIEALVAYAQRYGLNPARGHVVLMYSKPYITLDGYLYYANLLGQKYQLDSRPLEEHELTSFKAAENAHVWISTVKVEGTYKAFVGYGVVTHEEITEKSKSKPGQLRSPVVAKHPQQLAQKRAEWQALRRAFPIGQTEEEQKEVSNDRL